VRPDDGWVFLTARRQENGTVRIVLDERPGDDAVGDKDAVGDSPMRRATWPRGSTAFA
jgi:hypothetical protein